MDIETLRQIQQLNDILLSDDEHAFMWHNYEDCQKELRKLLRKLPYKHSKIIHDYIWAYSEIFMEMLALALGDET